MALTPGASPHPDGTTPPPGTGEAHPHTAALVPLTEAGFPAPDELSAAIKRRIDAALTAVRDSRTVTCPEDTHAAIRQLADWYARADDYARAFNSVKTHVEGACEEELLEAVGGRRGAEHVPARPMTVHDDGMAITLAPQFASTRDIDMDQVLTGLALLVADELDADPAAIGFAVEVARRAIGLYRSAEPSVKAVEALAAQASSRGDDHAAAAVRSAIGDTRRAYKDRVTVTIKPAA